MAALKRAILFVLIAFVIYGIFFPQLPVVNADELWETSRAYYLKTQHQPGEPLLPSSVSPFYSSIGKLGWKSWCLITAKSGSFALMMTVLPVSELIAMRIAMFCWSVACCLLTYSLARRLGLQQIFALLSVGILAALPEFFSQIHRERSELLLAASLLLFLICADWVRLFETGRKKTFFYFLIAGLSWLPSFLIHPSGILIPASLGVLFLLYERKNIFSLRTVITGAGFLAGAAFFLFLMNAMKDYAVANGGGDYFKYQGPPILLKDLTYFLKLPYAFYMRFANVNLLSRPVSFAVFIAGFAVIYKYIRNRENHFLTGFYLLVLPLVVTLVVLYLLSGSFGNFNVIVAPLICILIARYLQAREEKGLFIKKRIVIAALLFIFGVNLISLPSDVRAAAEYKRITGDVSKAITGKEPVLGIALYYNAFKDQSFFSNSWFNTYGGRPEQSFAAAVDTLNVRYVIVDDAFVGRALLDRGMTWTDSMMNYLSENGEVINEFSTHYEAGNRVPPPQRFPDSWRYSSQEKGYINRVRIIKLK